MSYKAEEGEGIIKGALIFQDGKTHLLPKLREGEIREIRVMPIPLFSTEEKIVTKIRMPDDVLGQIKYHNYKKRGEDKKYFKTTTRGYWVRNEMNYLIFLGYGRDNHTYWTIFEQKIREEEFDDSVVESGTSESTWD